MQRPAPSSLPALDSSALLHSQAMAAHLRNAIQAADGYLGFDAWMAQALYAPGLGYYAAGNIKLADATPLAQGAHIPAGDFVTAPELTSLFAQTLARQVAQVLHVSASRTILEFGAGTAALARGPIQDRAIAEETRTCRSESARL